MDDVTGMHVHIKITHRAAYLGYKAAGLPYGDNEQGLYRWAFERAILAVTPGAVIVVNNPDSEGGK